MRGFDFALIPRCFVDLTGTVRDPRGAPIAGATVAAANRNTVTDEDGRYRLTDLALGNNNAAINVQVVASKNPPGVNRIGDHWTANGTAALVCAREPVLDLTLVPVQSATLRGSVLEGELGPDGTVVPLDPPTPAVGVVVGLGGIGSATTGADGEYTFVDSTGREGIHVGVGNTPVPGNLTLTGPASTPLRQQYWPATVDAGEIAAGADVVAPTAVVLRRCTAAITGVVTDGQDPVAGARVVVRPADPGVSDAATVFTGPDGSFSVPQILFGVDNAPNRLTVTVTANGFEPSDTVESDVVGCGDATEVAVELSEEGDESTVRYGAVVGRVVDAETGDGIEGATVTLSGCRAIVPQEDCVPGETAADGTYVIARVPVGEDEADELNGTLTAGADTHYPATAPVPVKVGEPTGAPDISLVRRSFGVVRGVVAGRSRERPPRSPVCRSPTTARAPARRPRARPEPTAPTR